MLFAADHGCSSNGSLVVQSAAEQVEQQGALHVQAILGFVDHRAVRTVEHRAVDFHVATHRQAVHRDAASSAVSRIRSTVRRQSRRPSRRARSSSGRPNASAIPTTWHRRRGRREGAIEVVGHFQRTAAMGRGKRRRWRDSRRDRGRSPAAGQPSPAMPRCAAAMAALAGTAVGSALGCHAHISTKRLPRGLAEVLPQRQRVGQSLARVATRDSRLITGLSQYRRSCGWCGPRAPRSSRSPAGRSAPPAHRRTGPAPAPSR